MCGIVGYFKKTNKSPLNKKCLEGMAEAIAHRGPDGSGIYIGERFGLAHKRLAVIDLVTGAQPMLDDDDGKIIVFNGEIYNFRELRTELAGKGKKFLTTSDTEVLLKLSSSSTTGWVNRLNGMFSFAIYDFCNKTLLVSRDRLGVKPIYYVDTATDIVFASEIKPLLLHPSLSLEIEEEGVSEYLAYRSLSQNRTLFKDVHLLGPGCSLIIGEHDSSPRIVSYWSDKCGHISSVFDRKPRLELEKEFEELFFDSVKSRLISDVPVGTFNSGGLDSSLVSAAVKHLKEDDLHTFSVGFKESDFDESHFAQEVAQSLDTIHHSLVIDEQEYVKELEATIFSLEEPLNHPHTVPLKILCRYAKQYVTVVLTGEGADEVFAGYPRYHIPYFGLIRKAIPEVMRDFIDKNSSINFWRKLRKLAEANGELQKDILENSRFVPIRDMHRLGRSNFNGMRDDALTEIFTQGGNVLEKMLIFERSTYLSSLLVRLDKTSMHSALEARVPFLDYRIVEWSRRLPMTQKLIPGFDTKVIIKRVARKWLPPKIINRKKVGFGVPIKIWLRNRKGLGAYLEILTDSTFKGRGMFDATVVTRLVDEHVRVKADHSEILWSLLNLELWSRAFLDPKVSDLGVVRKGPIEISPLKEDFQLSSNAGRHAIP